MADPTSKSGPTPAPADTTTPNPNGPSPDWSRPIWVALFSPDFAGKIEPELATGNNVKWSIRPQPLDEINSTHQSGDPVIILRAASSGQPATVVAIAETGLIALNRSNGARIEFRNIHVLSIENIPLETINLDLPETLDETALFRLSEDQSKRTRTLIRKHVDLSVTGRLGSYSKPASKSPSSNTESIAETEPAPPPPETPQPPSFNTQSRFSHDRPTTYTDTLKRAPNAFVIAQYLNRLRGKPETDPIHDSYILHVDAPWGGGKTTFANFIANFLTYKRLKNQTEKEEFIASSDVGTDRLKTMSANNWMVLRFNAWENQHVSPPWWNFYTSFLHGYQSDVDNPAGLKISEWCWRIFTPETWRSITLAVILGVVGWLLYWIPGIHSKTGNTALYATLFGASTLAVFIFTQAKSGMKRIVDASNSAYNPTILGEEDPLTRLRDRFRAVAGYHNRPVLMIIDDIDRCEPEYVVELMRGLITIFQSNHVSYLILGDRGWIEQSFENVMDGMRDAHTDTTVSFGSRFAEKAIQMSYLLPHIPQVERQSYLRSLLPRDEAKQTEIAAVKTQVLEQFQVANTIAAVETQQKIAEAEIETITDPTLRQEKTEAVQTQAALARALADDRDDEIEHGLEEIWHLLPENPRRVKRLVNMIAVYQASAQSSLRLDPRDRKQWLPMVLWLILFSEFPNVSKAIHTDPESLSPLMPPNQDKLKLDWKLANGLSGDARAVINGIGTGINAIRLTPEVARNMRKLTPVG